MTRGEKKWNHILSEETVGGQRTIYTKLLRLSLLTANRREPDSQTLSDVYNCVYALLCVCVISLR